LKFILVIISDALKDSFVEQYWNYFSCMRNQPNRIFLLVSFTTMMLCICTFPLNLCIYSFKTGP
jgi:hypothetical protein